NDTLVSPRVIAIMPHPLRPTAFPYTTLFRSAGFVNNGFGLPLVNFTRGSTLLAQARATALTGSTSLTVPFPTAATALTPNLPGLSAGAVVATLYVQPSAMPYTLIGSVSLTVN